MLTVGFVISILIQVVLPIGLGYYLIRRYNSEWKILGVGMLAYLLAQVVQTPIFQSVADTQAYQQMLTTWSPSLVIILFGFLAALIENAARFGGFWLIREKGKAWGSALVMGAGHGGIEALMVGFQFLVNFVFAISITTSGTQSMNLPPEEAAELTRQVEAFWALPWYLPLASALQRLSALSLQLALSVMMWLAVSRKLWIFALAALLWHAALNSVAAAVSYAMPDVWNSILLVGVMLVNIAVIFLLYYKARETGPMEAPAPPANLKGLSFLERERERQPKPEEAARSYKEVIEAKRARQKQLHDEEQGGDPEDN